MAISRKLTKADEKALSVNQLIMKGGTSGEDPEAYQEEGDIKRVQLRIPVSKLDQMDKARRKRPGKLSRHTWVMEAIEEKLMRDETL